jgi:integrase
MGHYHDRSEFYEGAVVVFRRGDALSQGAHRFWQARFKIDGRIGFKTISLKTRNYEDAVAKAKSTYLQLSQTVRDGGSLENRTFERAWRDWYSFMLQENAWSPSRQKWHLNCFNRYFNAYFGSKKLDEITDEFANAYWNWRRNYWVNGEGVNQISYNRRRRGLKTHSTHNAKKIVSFTTLRMEQSALNQFFAYVYATKRYIRYPIKLKATASQRGGEARRPAFSSEEWNVLTRNLLSWADCKGKYASDRLNEYHRHQRQQLRYYVLFLASTGIRSGTETRFMKWEDIEFKEDHLKIRIRSATKMGRSRIVISMPNAVAWMKDWRAASHYPNHQDYVWYGQSKVGAPQVPATDFNKTFQSFLKSVDFKGREGGLLNDADGKRRSLYSCRHFYASQRLIHGLTYDDLRRNMGTGIAQLSRHYDHVLTEQRVAELTKTKFRQRIKST